MKTATIISNIYNLLIIIVLISVFYSCGNSQASKETAKRSDSFDSDVNLDKQNEKQFINKNRHEVESLINQYNAIVGWDTVYKYTYALHDLLIQSKNTFALEGTLSDIIKFKGNYYLKIVSFFIDASKFYDGKLSQSYIAYFAIHEQQLHKLIDSLNSPNHIDFGFFLFNVSDVVLPDYELLNLEGGCLGETHEYIDFDFNAPIIIKGEIISYYLYETTKTLYHYIESDSTFKMRKTKDLY